MTQPTPGRSERPEPPLLLDGHAVGAGGQLVYDARCWWCRRRVATEDTAERRYHETVALDTEKERP